MSNEFYVPGEQRAAKVNDLFATIARRYDLINDLQSFGLHRRWKRRVAELAGVKPGAHALDVCCGTGDLAYALAARGANVTGLDFSEPMLAVARSEVRSPKSKVGCPEYNPQFLHGDALRLPYRDDTFDVVTVGYGLRNLSCWEAVLSEMVRGTMPGGRVLVLDFGKPDNPLWRGIYFAYLRCCVPLLGLIFCGNAGAYAYILESLKHYPAQRGVETKMQALGLANVLVVNLLGGAMSINCGGKPPHPESQKSASA